MINFRVLSGSMQQMKYLPVVFLASFICILPAAHAAKISIDGPDSRIEVVVAQPRANPYALQADSRKHIVRFSVLVQIDDAKRSKLAVFLRRKGDKQGIAMNDLGVNGDYIAKDGVYGVSLQIDTSKTKPDTCLIYESYIKRGRAETVSQPLRYCVSSFPVRVSKPDVKKPVLLSDGVKAVADEVIIYALPSTSAAAIRELARSIDAKVVGSIPPLYLYQLRMPAAVDAGQLMELMARLNANKELFGASVNALAAPAGHVDVTTDPEFASQHGVKLVTQHPTIANNYVWDAGAIGTGVTVIVADEGLDRTHPEFGTLGDCQVIGNNCGPAAVNDDNAAAGVLQWHGTRVAGIIAAKAYNTQGIAGVAHGSKILPYKITSYALTDLDQIFTDAGGYVVSDGASVINASFSGGPWSGVGYAAAVTALCSAVNTAITSGSGAIAVIAAGNNGADNWYYPARCNQHASVPVGNRGRVIAVGNSTSVDTGNCGWVGTGQRCAAAVPANPDLPGSNYGTWVDLMAPGSDIRTTKSGGYDTSTGTSFSTPVVSGAVAILKSCGVTLDSIKSTLISGTAATVHYPSAGSPTTTPRLDVYGALSSVNHAPTSVSPAISSVNEGSGSGTLVATLSAVDADVCDKKTYSIIGANPGGFVLDANTGALTVGAVVMDYEALPPPHSYSLTVRATDFFGATFNQAITVNVNNLNDNPPVITSNGGGASAAVNVPENTTAVTTVTATDTDALGALSYSIIGGADAGIFNINGSSGALSFSAAPDFEAHADVGGDNVYDVTVQVSDGTNTDVQAIAVTVTNANDSPPVITSDGGGASAAVSVPENTTAVTTVTATDADALGALSYSIVPGLDGGSFTINSSSGVLSFSAAPDFEAHADAGGNNVYDVTVQVSDGTNTDVQAIAVTLTNVNDNTPVITSDGGGATAALSRPENTTLVTTVVANDVDALGSLSYSISGGADSPKFSIDAMTGALSFIVAPDFEAHADAGGNDIYDVTVRVSDGANTDTQAIAVTVTNASEAPTGNPAILPPDMAGNRTVGQLLTADLTPIYNPDAWPVVEYRWKREGASLGVNASSYTLVAGDIGGHMSVCVLYADMVEHCSTQDSTAVGDPHITTVDGLHYDFQGAGEFVALRGAGGMEVQLRMAAVSTAPPLPDSYTGLTSGVSVNTAVAAHVGQRRVTYQPDPAVAGAFLLRVDGVVTALPAEGIDLGDGGRVVPQASGGIQIDFPDHTTLMVNSSSWPFYGAHWLHVSVFHTSAYEGIMGARKNGSWLPRLSNGSALGAMPVSLHDRYVQLYEKFADSWRVTDKTSLFDYAEGTSTATFTNKKWPTENGPYDMAGAPVAKPLDKRAAELACRDVVGKNEKADCVFDVRVMGNGKLARGHLLNQKIRLGAVNVLVRTADKLNARGELLVTAKVARHATVVPKVKGIRTVPAGTVQFMLGGKALGKPVRLDAKGQATFAVSRQDVVRLKEGKQAVTAQYLPAQDKANVFLPAISKRLTPDLLPVALRAGGIR